MQLGTFWSVTPLLTPPSPSALPKAGNDLSLFPSPRDPQEILQKILALLFLYFLMKISTAPLRDSPLSL